MRLYLAYKYRAIPDKYRLQNDLISISDTLCSAGHEVFVLGRDVQNWKNSSTPLYKTLPAIIKNLIKSDKIVVFFESKVKSDGLSTEMFFAKLLKKPVILLHKEEIEIDEIVTPEKTIRFTHITELLEKVKNI